MKLLSPELRSAVAVSCAIASVCSGQVIVPPGELTFRGQDESGHTYYGYNDPLIDCTNSVLAPGVPGGLVPSMCWGPRPMWYAQDRTCPNHFDRDIVWHTDDILYDRELPDGDVNSWWGQGVEGLSGLRMNINLQLGAVSPTLPPRSYDPRKDGSPLVPADPTRSSRPVAMWTRPMIGDSVDLVTGIPMVQETDLELPFGSAVYRHTRTYSEMAPGRFEDWCYNESINQSGYGVQSTGHFSTVAGDFYDWHGQGWMIGEAPLFLIDAHYHHVVYDGGTAPRRCYFVVNAHQSIPFDFDPQSAGGQYIAPPNFDAFLEHDGDWNQPLQKWDERPTIYRVWLYNKTVCYTIRAMYEDVFPGTIPPDAYDPTWDGVPELVEKREVQTGDGWPASDHDTPILGPVGTNLGANGVPYWGVVERIDDRYGNCIDLHYCDFRVFDAGFSEGAFDTSGDDCEACAQACNEKGQIAYARLISGSDFLADGTWTTQGQDVLDVQPSAQDASVEWTLLYTHRSFPEYVFSSQQYEALDTHYPYHQQTAIHSIHVFEGEVSSADLVCRTLPYSMFVDDNGDGPDSTGYDTILDPLDEIKPGIGNSERAIPAGWMYELRYLYAEPDPRLDRYNTDGGTDYDVQWYEDAYGFSCPVPGSAARLLKVTVTTDHELSGDPDLFEEQHTLYRWGSRTRTADEFTTWSGSIHSQLYSRLQYSDLTTLKAIYRPADVADVLGRLADWDPVPWTVNTLVLGDNANSSLLSPCATGGFEPTLDNFDFETGVCEADTDDIELSHIDLASSVLLRWNRHMPDYYGFHTEADIADYGLFWDFEDENCAFADDLMANFVLSSDGSGNTTAGNPERLKYKLIVPGVHMVRGADGNNPADRRAFRVYRFRYFPEFDAGTYDPDQVCYDWLEPLSGSGGVDDYFEPRRSIYHWPFRDDPTCESECATTTPASLNAVTWVTVVDEYDTLADMKLVDAEVPGENLEWTFGTYMNLPNKRRVIFMNAAGWTLSEDTWEFGDGGTSYARTGAREEFEFDADGRMTEHKTLSWGSEENVPDRATAGLIELFEYPTNVDVNGDGDYADEGDHFYHEISRRGVKFGDTGTPIWLEEHTYRTDRLDLPATSVFYADVNGTESYTTEHYYKFDSSTGDPADWLITHKTTLGPAMTVGIGTAAGSYRPQETQIFSDGTSPSGGYAPEGRLQWRVYGLEHVSGDSRYATRFFDYTHYDYGGRVSRQVVDLDGTGNPPPDLGAIADLEHGGTDEVAPDGVPYPADWSYQGGPSFSGGRVAPAGNEPMHRITKYLNRSWGVWVEETPYGSDAYPPPNGRQVRTYNPRRIDENWTMEQRVATFTGYDTSSGESEVVERGQVSIFGGDRTNEVKSVRWLFGTGQSPKNHDFVELVNVDIEHDANGRPAKVEATGWDGKEISAEVETNHFGAFTRERQPDGTVTRTYCDPRGRPERVFTGVQDQDAFWGYLPAGDDDLILTTQNRYGEGRTTINRVTMTRHFRDRPTGQYSNWDWQGEGWVEWRGYDNRMREVWNRIVEPGTEQYDSAGMIAGGDSLRTRVTIYDNLDRVLFVAEYGSSAPAGPDAYGDMTINGLTVNGDVQLPGFDTLASTLLGSSPISLSGTVYNDAGLAVQQRQYDVTDASAATYLSTVTHYDGKGRPVIEIAPNTAPIVNEYDALGRLTVRRVVKNLTDDPPIEIQRTETEYDGDGNALVVRTLGRLHDDAEADPDLDIANNNCIAMTVWNWYDSEGMLTATADLGSGNGTSDTLVTPSAGPPIYDQDVYDNPPSVDGTGAVTRGSEVPDWAVVTCYKYNAVGRKWVEAKQISYDEGTGTHAYLVNTYQYDSLGNVVFMTENATAAQGSQEMRQTAYLYENGRMVKIGAVLPGHDLTYLTNVGAGGGGQGLGYYTPDWAATDGTIQITYVDYLGWDVANGGPLSNGEAGLGARVWTGEVDGNNDPIWSHNKTWPARVFFPDKTTGQPDLTGGADLDFTYYSDGLVRSRKDRLGREFIHIYDEQSQRIRTEIIYPTGLFPNVGGTDYTPGDLADLLVYEYDDQGRLTKAYAGQDLNGDDQLDETNDVIISHNQYTYHDRGGLKFEYQSYGELVDLATTPVVEYLRDYTDYEEFETNGSGNRDRLTGMVYPVRKQSAEERQVTLMYGASAGDIDDVLSRVTRIHDTTATTPARAVAFDHAGSSRRVARSWQVDASGSLSEIFAQTFDTGGDDGYAGLDRLGRMTDLHFTPDGGQTTIHQYQYGYDSAGNRLTALVTQDGEVNTRSWLHSYDQLGRLVSSERGELTDSDSDGVYDTITQSLGTPSSRIAWGLDRLGNWSETADGYEGRVEHEDLDGSAGYEALVLAADHATDLRNELTGIAIDDGSGPDPTDHVHDAAGNLVADGMYYYQYDAFNRLAGVYEQNDLGFDANGIPTSGTPGDWRSSYAYDALGRRISRQVPWDGQSDSRWAWYYYDGVRRIQEVHRDPLPPSSIGGNPNPAGSYVTYTDREYVWGPDYVDECLWQVDRTGTAAFVLQDANFNVVALLDQTGQVLQQYDYTPYGTVLAADVLGSYANNRLGFQGLFVDRLDVDAPNAEMVPEALSTSYARNRDYRSDLGRWSQPDPVGTRAYLPSHPLGTIAAEDTGSSPPVISAHYLDGMNHFVAMGSSPLIMVDPNGESLLTVVLGSATFRAGLRAGLTQGIAGALFGGVGGGFSHLVTPPYSGQGFWLSVGQGAAFGFLGGATGGFATPFLTAGGLGSLGTSIIAGGMGGAVSSGGLAMWEGRSIEEVASSAAVGALTGGLFGSVPGLADANRATMKTLNPEAADFAVETARRVYSSVGAGAGVHFQTCLAATLDEMGVD